MATEKCLKRVAIIAGQGRMPRELYDACTFNGIETHIIGLEDQVTKSFFDDISIDTIPIHSISQIIKHLKLKDIHHLLLAGKVRRSVIPKLILDIKGAKLFASIIKNGLSDKNLTQTIIRFLEKEGFIVLSPELVAKDILVCSGNMTNIPIKKSHLKDIEQGHKMLTEICKFDVGQSLIIQNGLILGVEAVEGTDELIKRCGLIKQKFDTDPILIKICKPSQDRRIDMPCIGEQTITKMHEYGIKGIGLQTSACLILNKKQTIELANKHGIFIYGFQ